MKLVLAILSLIATAAYCQPADQTSNDIQDAAILIRLKILPESAFDPSRVAEEGRRFLSTAAASHKVAALLAYDHSSVAAREAGGCEGSYKQWRFLYDRFPETQFAAAEVISLGRDAVLRLRTTNGAIRRIVLRGTDPTEFSFEGVKFEVLHVNGRVRSQFEGCSPGVVDPIIYLMTSAVVDKNLCRRLTRWLTVRLGTRYMDVRLAHHPWFPCEGRFPLQYPFIAEKPSEADVRDDPRYSCDVVCDGEVICDREVGLR